jgi:glycosyltransferase involved in cell wall biosynthesis
VAAGIDLPGSHGGSTHTWEVARGLHARGHEVVVVAHSPRGTAPGNWRRPIVVDGVEIRYLDLPKSASLFGYPAIALLARQFEPAVVIERYYNLAGAGVLAAHRRGIPILLEVNALIVDPPVVFKRRLDDRLGGPLRRWAAWQCHAATRIVAPLASTIPPEIDRGKIVELPWGANVERFTPRSGTPIVEMLRTRLGLPAAENVAAFAGSFRVWHGVQDFMQAAIQLVEAGSPFHFLLIGDGPERTNAEQIAAPYADRFHFLGSVPHSEMPSLLALAGVGVAPFNSTGHPALRAAGFFWSPLKIYEYMATGLPVVTPAIPPLDTTIREGVEGALYPEGNIPALASAIKRVLVSPQRTQLGLQARERVVRDFSWERHCQELERILVEIRRSGPVARAHG